ncbi:aspartate carbamoyltransferase catalytic subunit [Natronospira proteinivora]|uniref:Aspartate carbamoyltransferase n=1 Tax=Natronospira proteinivora TaxID=1807133 RepID=A0ABT1GAP4_9GAMM|nr:aspartate carbamoyltransferase catalytic subunit [Natronospira proteinivora]MCP1728399.1 aspartate carbamoyltransferase catalytic subunit [Natronospira proteinivora]
MSQHLLSIRDLDADTLKRLVADGQAFAKQGPTHRQDLLQGQTIAMLFYEPSTRTRCSFELAARRLGADVLNLDMQSSSSRKGETVADTVATLAAMGVRLFVMRHEERAAIDAAARALPDGCHLLNAGAGTRDHPTQILLDLLTLAREGHDIQRLDLSIIGDLRHSRVVNSWLQAIEHLGCHRLRLGAPGVFRPETVPPEATLSDTLADSIQGAQVIMALRIQQERLTKGTTGENELFHEHWGLNEARIAEWAPQAQIMHPGPMNRGVEIDSALADGPRSLILKQVENGVPARMAALAWLFSGDKQR